MIIYNMRFYNLHPPVMVADANDVRNKDCVFSTSRTVIGEIIAQIQAIKDAIRTRNIPLLESHMHDLEDYLDHQNFESLFSMNPELQKLKSEALLFLDKIYETFA